MFACRAVRATVLWFRAFCIAFLSLISFTAGAQTPQSQVLHHHLRPEVISHAASLLGSVPDDQIIHSSFVLPLRDPDGLKALLVRLYDPSSPDYHHFLSVDQFTAQFGPTSDDFNAVVAFAQANGLAVASLPANRIVVPFSGTAAQVNAAFHVQMSVYQHPTEQRTFISPDREPSLNLAIPVAHISGLDDFSLPQPNLIRGPSTQAQGTSVTGSGPSGSYLGSDMRAAYYGGSTLTGNGQAVGILEFGGYARSDVDLTFSGAGQTYNVPINDVLLNGATTGLGTGDAEQVLDIVQAIGMAPGLSQVRVYIGPAGSVDDANILNSMASENIAKQLSCSWSWLPVDPTVDDPFFQEMAVQGQSFFTASGDSGAYDQAISRFFYPQEDQYVTTVGGTHLGTNGAGGGWTSETVWNSGGGGSGGGISPDGISIPSWQIGLANSANGGSTTLRNIPDVAMEGDFDNFSCENGACNSDWAGTSFAAPRWAGFMALVNQQAQEAGNAPTGGIGFLNTPLYRLAQGSASSGDFHDITSGNNRTASQPLWFSATPGYDLTTGWGSANGQALIDDLAGPQVPGFWLASSQSSISVNPGGNATDTITILAAGGFSGQVSLAATNLPQDVTASFSPNPATGSSVLTFTANNSAVQSTQSVTITGTSGTLSASTKVALAVHTPSFSLSASPSPLGISQGASGTATVTVTSLYGFSSAVNLAISGLPSGVTASFSPTSTTGTSTLTLNVSSTATPNTSTLTITGTSGSITVSTSLSLAVHGPSFLLSGPGSLSIGQGSYGTFSVYIEDLYGFTGNVNLAVSGLPTGITATVTPNPASSLATITFTASTAAATGPSVVTVTGTSGSLSASTTLTLSIFAPTFTLSSVSSVSIGQGSSSNDYVYIVPQYGFNATVNLSISGLPAGVTAIWSPNPTNASSILTLAASASGKVGQYPIVITGTSGTQTATTNVTVGVFTPTFTLSGGGSVSVGQGTSATSYLYVNPQYGFTGSVNLSASGLPAGVTATFSPNPATGYVTITLNASSTATLGQYNATITGTSGSQTATTTLTVGVYAPTFTLSNYGGVSVGRGSSSSGYISINQQYGFNGSVTLSVSGLPSGVTASFSPNPTTSSSNLVINASATAALGQYSVTVTGTSGTQTTTTIVSITIYNPSFTLSAYGTGTLGQGASTTASVYITPQYGFTGSVNLSVSGLPSGVTATFSPNPTTGNTTLTLTASTIAATGQYNLTITGTSGTITQTTTLNITVGAPTFTLNAYGPTIGQGSSGSSYVYVNDLFGFGGSVNFSVSGLPSGVTAAFSPTSSTYSSTLSFNVANTAAIGATTITITGTSGSTTVTTTMLLTVVAPSFSMFSGFNSIQLNQGANTSGYLYISGNNGFSGSVTLSATGLPAGASIVFSPNPTTSYSNQCTINAGTAAPGTYTVTITGTSGTATASTTFVLTIEAASYTLSASPSSVVLNAGGSQKSTISLIPLYGFSGSVTYAVTGLPTGVTASISPNPSTGQTVITFSAVSGAATASTAVTLTGTSGSTSSSVLINLNVVQAAQATSTILALSSNGQSISTLSAGSPVTLTAAVAAGSTPITVGQVLFCDASAKFCDLNQTLGVAQLTTTGTATLKFIPSPGNNSYKAIFSGTPIYLTSASSTSSLAVTSRFASQTVMNVTGNTSNYAVTATVTGSGTAAPSGSVAILDSTENNASLGTVALNAIAPALTSKILASPTVDIGPTAIASGDFNGDGITDLATANNGPNNTISVLLGNGDGTFRNTPSLPLGIYANSLCVGDFNGDGVLDLAAARNSGNSIAIYLGNGDGTFAPAQESPQAGSYFAGLVAADFNGDGIQDLAVASTSNSSVTILLGNGNATFNPTTFTLGSNLSPYGLIVGDFNGDGRLDLAVPTSNGSLIVLAGNGDGSFFQGPTLVATYTSANTWVAGDVNSDGKLDLVGIGYAYNLTTLLGNGDGTFSVKNSGSTQDSYPTSMTIGDVNRDGKLDIISTSHYNSSASIFFGIGDGTFAGQSSIAATSNLGALITTDLNGDGIPDLAAVNGTASNITVIALGLNQTATGTATGISPHGTGQHGVLASFPADGIFGASRSATQNLNATPGPPAVTVSPASNSIATTQAVAVTVSVVGGSADPTPTGSVQLTAGTFVSPATALVNGIASFSIPAGSLDLGTDNVTAVYTPDSAASSIYLTATGTATVTAGKTPSVVTWPTPASITYGTALSAAQLDATSSVTGTFTYSPALGTVLPAGTQTLSVTFTPTDSKYTASSGTVTLTVNKATLTITAANVSRVFGSANPNFTGTLIGAANGDTFAESFATSATAASPAGTYPIVPSVTGAALSNYTVTANNGTLTVTGAITKTALTLSNNNLTFTATITSSVAGTLTGQVTFYAGSTLLGSSTLNAGVATYTVGAFPSGNAMLSAVYSGDANFSGSSSTAVPVLAVAPASTSLTVAPASSVQDVLTLSVAPGYVGSLQVACSGLPQNATCSLSPSSFNLVGGASSVTTTLTIHTGGTSNLSPAISPFGGQGNRGWLAALGIPGLLGVAFTARRRRLRTIFGTAAILAVFFFSIFAVTGCASGSSSGSTSTSTSTVSSAQTPTGIYTVQVTTTGALSLSQTTVITLAVQ